VALRKAAFRYRVVEGGMMRYSLVRGDTTDPAALPGLPGPPIDARSAFRSPCVFGSRQDRRQWSLMGLRSGIMRSWCGGTAVLSPAWFHNPCWVERVLLLANDINLTSRVFMSDRFYTRTIPFQMLQ
jgi:hypothetical protein